MSLWLLQRWGESCVSDVTSSFGDPGLTVAIAAQDALLTAQTESPKFPTTLLWPSITQPPPAHQLPSTLFATTEPSSNRIPSRILPMRRRI